VVRARPRIARNPRTLIVDAAVWLLPGSSILKIGGYVVPALALSLAATPAPVGAQDRASPRQPPSLIRVAASLSPTLRAPRAAAPLDSERAAIRAAVRRTRWREGLIAGAVVFAVVGGYVAGGFCAADDGATGAASNGCTEEILGGGVAGAAVGGLIGGLIGSRIGRGPPQR
jgi:hypothetical protein